VAKITTAVTVDEYGRRPMIVLGLLLVLLAVGATAVAVTAPTATPQVVSMTAVGVTVRASPLAMFLAGAVSVLLLGLGLALISQGTRRKARARKTLRRLRKDRAATPEVSADAGGIRAAAMVFVTATERTPRRTALKNVRDQPGLGVCSLPIWASRG
jgi:MFS family permease